MIPVNPCRIVARHGVAPDLLGWFPKDEPAPLDAGKEYAAAIYGGGAVAAFSANGKTLGLKPGEFDFVCPLVPDGETVLENNPLEGGNVWRVFSRVDGKRARIVWSTPLRQWMWSEM